ncbi:MAG TPA: hypothetical protein VMR33_06940 [Candidatus Baltobacteraceae bacterium]|jgi:hypothetical protein|nr:hypothetical protein [Candidatus Baltobacteraceae bacterium]
MNGHTQEFPVWTRGRFLGIVAMFFVLQAGLIALFGARSVRPAAAPPPSTQFRAVAASMSEEQLRRLFFASDPAVFPLPNPHGFSGRAWMDQPPPQYHSTNQLEPPLWLALDAVRLGTGPADLDNASGAAPLSLPQLPIPQADPLPVFLSPVIIPTQSVFRIQGELAARLLGPPPALNAWPSTTKKLLTNTVVQIAVNQAGDVMAARLLTRSGSPDADGDAVAKAWALRFQPSADALTLWAQAVFRWQTTFPAAAGTQP